MHISVRDILTEEMGYNRTFAISGERPEMPNVKLTADISGQITLSKLESGILARGWVETEIELECHRCLSAFSHSVRVNLEQTFKDMPDEDEMPIVADEIDLAPLIEQEILVSLPIKLLCRADCPGVPNSESYLSEPTTLKHQARINERKNNART